MQRNKRPSFTKVTIQVTQKEKSKSVNVRVTLPNKDRFRIFSGVTCEYPPVGLTFPPEEPMHKSKTEALSRFYSQVYTYVVQHPELDGKKMKDGIDIMLGRKEQEPTGEPIIKCFGVFIEERATGSTCEVYTRTMKRIAEFDKHATLDTIDADWLKRFTEWHGQSHKINGTAMMLRNIRAVFNHAIEQGLTTNYPFKRYKIKHEQTAKRNLTLEQLRTLRDFPCEEFQKEYRDIFLLTLYLRGINMVDLLHLTTDNIHGDKIEYIRKKTDKVNAINRKLVTVKIEPEAMEIIERYRGKRYLLAPLDRYTDYHDYTHHMNDALKTIGKVYRIGVKAKGEPLFPNITTYWSRHTWASIAAEADIAMETIAYALGHSTGFSTTEIYVNFSQKKIDDANRKVIDLLNEDIKPRERQEEQQCFGWYYDGAPNFIYVTS